VGEKVGGEVNGACISDMAASGQRPMQSNECEEEVSMVPQFSQLVARSHCNKQSPVPHTMEMSSLQESCAEHRIFTSVAEEASMRAREEHEA